MKKRKLAIWQWSCILAALLFSFLAVVSMIFGIEIFGRIFRSGVAATWAQTLATAAVALSIALFDKRHREREASRAMASRLASCIKLFELAESGIRAYTATSQRDPKHAEISVWELREQLRRTLERVRRIDDLMIPHEAMAPLAQAQLWLEKAIATLPDDPTVRPSEGQIAKLESLRQKIEQSRAPLLELLARAIK